MAVRAAKGKRLKPIPSRDVPLKGVKIVKVGTAVGLTLNMGNYESLRLECSMEAEVAGDVNADLAWAHLATLCQRQLQRDFDSGDWPLVSR